MKAYRWPLGLLGTMLAVQARAAGAGGGAVASGAQGLIDYALAIGAVIVIGIVMYWGILMQRGMLALGVIAASAIGVLIFMNPEDIVSVMRLR